MPKVVDHATRRGHITAAVRDLIGTAGLDAVTVARAAEAAGVSVGQVQHYFASKDELLEHTYRQVIAATWERIDALTRQSNAQRLPIRDVVTEAMTRRLPLDPASSADHRVVLALLSRTWANRELDALYRDAVSAVRQRLAEAIDNGKECGEVDTATDAAAEAVGLLGLADGLAMQLSGGASSADAAAARATVETAVQRVFSGQCRQWD